MSTLSIFIIGVVTSILCLLFLIITIVELRKLGEQAEKKIGE